ncbi:MAG TPA: insulinase family protein [Bacteroidales bacterium]|nr:insulinase family protein [Bacteroidales bacterium]
MKFRLLIVLFLAFSVTLFSQKNSENLKVNSFTLKNGLTVYLNEDHSVPNVLGAVIIKTGGKYDPADHTGTSHYLEHMMFKGTDELGTIDYESEKVIIEKIAGKYEELAKTTDEEQRKTIQKEINALSLEAGKYAIPNELDRILDQMGSSGVNAFTSEEIVAYFNVFPKNQIEKWIVIYSHRFKNPVFRLFQSELETVFEEKNMYMDDFSSNLIETFYKYLYRVHPYGTQTVIGTAEHVKNPSLNNMRKMYETYYVANNMALVLTGNFNSKEVIPLIEKYFGEWKSGKVPEYPVYEEKAFNGVERVEVKMTPVKIGLLGFRTVKTNDKDEVVLDVCQALLSNSASTGYLDKLSLDGKLLEVISFNDIRNDHGALMVLFVPKVVGQSLKKAEELVYNEIARLRVGDIDKEFFEAVKLNIIKEHQQSLENSQDRAFLIGFSFISGETWEEVLNYPAEVEAVTLEDVKRVSEKYLNTNYLSFNSKMGFPDKDKLEKPGFDPVIPENAEAKSIFAKKFEELPEAKIEPEFIDFEKDVKIIDIADQAKLYYVENDVNEIFNLTIKYRTGKINNNRYEQLAEYVQLIGTEKYKLNEFNNQLQKYGCSFSVYAEDNYFNISIDGFDKYFKESVSLVLSLIESPVADDSKLKNLLQNATFQRKYESGSPDDVASALFYYGIYGDNSSYLRRMTVKQVKSLTSLELIKLLKELPGETHTVHYSGTLKENDVAEFYKGLIKSDIKATASSFPIILPRKEYSENTILFLDDPKALQSNIYFYVQGNINDEKERVFSTAYNQYFGTGMSAIVFQEVREFRSMAYTAYAVYRNGFLPSEKGYLQAFVGTQSDKTVDVIGLMDSLINQMPVKENRMPDIQSALLQSINSNKPEWRNISETVERWQVQKYKEDPRILQFKIYRSIDFKNILEFYNSNIQNRPLLITIVGNKKQINMEELAKFGKIIVVDKKQIMN